MPSDLDLLVDHYQWEVQRLETLIKEHKEQHFYEEVILDSKALSKASRELDRLLNLKYPNHSKIQNKKNLISSIKKMEKKISLNKLQNFSFMDSEINNLKKEIDKLSKEKSESNFETQILDEEIYKLLKNQVKGVMLKIQCYDNRFFLNICKIHFNELKVEFWMEEPDEKSFLKRHDITKELRFLYNDTTEKFTRRYKLDSVKNILPFKEFLARLICGLQPDLELGNTIYAAVR
ncbi:hypothetical protein MTsPCn9_14980 [Croceitalea sp. MTPC9]|uniref:hypothetical protein n=1 Tax=unclassified Croceitalea TaxID=2632280 RepID=UPI002B36D6F1|nr:hypothetical protein MTsPCn6_14150 [Croceitalea sp. MTPC6]GMN16562.1 hypothetical protein MTsPCn9_14980 [Croceitalea sp. MTPC9]